MKKGVVDRRLKEVGEGKGRRRGEYVESWKWGQRKR